MEHAQSIFDEEIVAPDLSGVPLNSPLSRLAKCAQELADTEAKLARAEALVDAIKARRHRLATKVLPEMLDEAGTDHVGVPCANADVVVSQHVHAAILASWDEPKRQKAFAHLEALGGADLIRAVVSVSFGREEYGAAVKLWDKINLYLAASKQNARAEIKNEVNWSTLTSFVRAELEAASDPHKPRNKPTLELDTLGASVYRLAKIVPRKENKPKRGVRKVKGEK